MKIRNPLQTLYQKVGQEAGLQRVLDDFYARMSRDVLIGFYFDGKDISDIARRQKDFLMKAMGASASYGGKLPAQAHQNLPPILTGHFDRRLKILEETLRDHGLSSEDIRIWLNFERAFRGAIVSM